MRSFFQFLKSFFSKKQNPTSEPKETPVSELTWQTRDGRVLKITEMDTSHLKSTVNWMERVASRTFLNELSLPKHPKYQAMRAELEKRELRESNG